MVLQTDKFMLKNSTSYCLKLQEFELVINVTHVLDKTGNESLTPEREKLHNTLLLNE